MYNFVWILFTHIKWSIKCLY